MFNFSNFLLEHAFLLSENRVEFVKKNFKSKIDDFLEHHKHLYHNETSDQIVDWIADRFDPSRNKAYVQWLINQLFKHPETFEEDQARIRGDLETFERVKARMPGDQRDINRYKNYHDLGPAIAPYEDSKSKNEIKDEEAEKFKADIKYLYRGPEGVIAIPTSQAASCYLGRGTKWCTAATNSANYFHSYSKDGPLYVLMHKDGTKWQFHLHSKQYMDEFDSPLPVEKIATSNLVPHLERIVWNEIKKNPFDWAKRTGSKNPEILHEIAKSTQNSYEYARAIGKRFPLGEPAILKDKALAIQYTRDVIKGRWPELETVLANAPSFIKRGYEHATGGR